MENKSAVYITNYWNNRNHGAMLTACALYKVVRDMGYKAFLVNIMNYKDNLKYAGSLHKKFIDKNCEYTLPIQEYKNLKKINKNAIFITGSDQVFRKCLKPKIFNLLLLDYVDKNCKKIALSASFGVDKKRFLEENSAENIDYMKKSLESFDKISVREDSGVDICKNIFNTDAANIIDPVFVPDKEYFSKLADLSKENYTNKIGSYIFNETKEHKKLYKYLKTKYNAEVVAYGCAKTKTENVLKMIRDCKFVITNSFHGLCFAVIFNKPFICIVNQETGLARFSSVLNMLGIKNQCISSVDEIYTKDCFFDVDYTSVNKRISEEKQKCMAFLKEALEMPAGKFNEKEIVQKRYFEEKITELDKAANLKSQLKKIPVIIWYKFLLKLFRLGK